LKFGPVSDLRNNPVPASAWWWGFKHVVTSKADGKKRKGLIIGYDD
jgi:hypothetical protein